MQSRLRGRLDIAELVIGLLLMVAAAVILFDAQRLPPGSIYGVGPSAVPTLVAAGMIVLGLMTVMAAWRRSPVGEGEAEEGGTDVAAVVVILASLAALIALMTLGGGFILACTVLFAGTAWAFGRRAPLADIAIGFVLALVIYAVFTKALTLALPDGPMERLVQRGLDLLVQSIKAM